MKSHQCSIKLPSPVVAFSLITMITVYTLTVLGQGAWSWLTVKPPGENFSVRMPKQPSQEEVSITNMPNLSGTAYSATGGKIYYTVRSIRAERGGNPQSRLNDFVTKFKQSVTQISRGVRLTDSHALELNGFVGQQFRIITSEARVFVRIYSTRQRIYMLEVAGGDEEDAPVGWFLDSFAISEPPPGGGGGGDPTPSPQPPVPIYTQCACDPLGNPIDQASTEYVGTRDAIFCTQGDLELTEEARKHQFNGEVILEVELLENGTVGGIKVIQSQPYGLEQKAVEAARQYKFCPALQDGQPVKTLLTFTCRFTVTVRTIYQERPARKARGRRRP